MPTNREIYQSAHALIQKHGSDAPLEAARRADAFLEQGNPVGEAVWLRILRAAESLLNSDPPSDRLH